MGEGNPTVVGPPTPMLGKEWGHLSHLRESSAMVRGVAMVILGDGNQIILGAPGYVSVVRKRVSP